MALSLGWSMSSGDEVFERGEAAASIEGLFSLSEELGEEEVRLRTIYGRLGGASSGVS